MWSYYGSKSKIVDCYPPPKYGKIIEPFAGSARYALKYWDREVLLVEKNIEYVNLWKWLQSASKKDIDNLPILKIGDDIRDFKGLCSEEILLLKHVGQCGTATPGFVCTEMGWKSGKTAYNNFKNQISKIRRWEIRHGCYTDLGNEDATWFIDPPYQFGGHKYKFGNSKIEFGHLAVWCKSRKGQAIVCENSKADWLDFRQLKQIQGGANTNTKEVIWSNLPTAFDNIQTTLDL